MTRWLRAAWLGAALWGWAWGVHAQCEPRLTIRFADDARGCLSDYPAASQRALGSIGAMHRQVPGHGNFELALPRRPSMCPRSMALWAAPGSTMAVVSSGQTGTSVRDCQRSAGAAPGGSACECQALVVNGVSPLRKAEFDLVMREAAVPESVALDTTWRRSDPLTDTTPAPTANVSAAPPGDSGTCSSRLQVALADGSRTCLSDYRIADRRAPGLLASLARAVPAGGRYTIAAASPAAQCPAAWEWAFSSGTAGSGMSTVYDQPEARAQRALQGCRASLKSAGASAACDCVLLVADGMSPLRRSEFAQLANATDPVVPAVARNEPPAPAPQLATKPSPQPEASPAAVPAPVVAATPGPPATSGPTSAELNALRDQLQALQRLIAQQQAAAAAPTVTPPPAAPARPKLKARALIIGNGKYQNLGTLPNPPNDARAMADKLRQFGIEVDLLLDADRAALVRGLGEYQARAAGYDVNILYYAGHGLQVDGVNYVVPVEMATTGVSAGSVKLNAVSLNDALEYLPAKTRVVFLDACRDNPLSRSLRATRSSAGLGLAPVSTTSGTLVAYATKDGSTAEDGRGRNSPYTEALLRHLDADEDIAIVLRRVRQAVLSSTDQRQEPWEYGSLVGDQLVLSRLAR